MINSYRSVLSKGLLLILLGALNGCTANFTSQHFVLAYDPTTDVTNYFRVTVKGDVFASRAKYSSGQYDRDAVNQLFGEGVLEREFLSSHLNILSAETDDQLKELQSTLAAASAVKIEIRKQQLHQSYATAAGLIEQYKTDIEQEPELKNRFTATIGRAESLRDSALGHLGQSQWTEAAAAIRQIQVIVNAIRVAVDGRVSVRFFDGDGLEIDVTNKKEVIFVATDTEQFTQALSQLAEAEDATKNLIQIFLGDEIRRQSFLSDRLKREQAMSTVGAQRMQDIMTLVASVPADKSASAAAEQTTARTEEQAQLMSAILGVAAVIADSPRPFTSGNEIRSFANGLEMANDN